MKTFNHLLLPIAALVTALAGCDSAGQSDFDGGTLVLVGGDTHFAEDYARPDKDGKAKNDMPAEDYRRGFVRLKPLLDRSAFAVVNLETPLSPQLADANLDKAYVHWTYPDKTGPALVAAGIDAVGLANNHTVDQGNSGLIRTFVELDKHKLAYFGAGNDLADAEAPLLHEITLPGGGKRLLAFFGMFEEREKFRTELGFYAGEDKSGVAPIDTVTFARQVTRLRAERPGVFIVAFPHWGENYAWANREQVRLGRELIDAGADMVIGQHAHTLQEIERYQDKWIVYGIGNFLFNAPCRYAKYRKVKPFGLVAQLSFGRDPKAPPAVRLHPFLSDNRKSSYQPRPATLEETRTIVSAIQSRSKSIGFDARVVDNDPAGTAFELKD